MQDFPCKHICIVWAIFQKGFVFSGCSNKKAPDVFQKNTSGAIIMLKGLFHFSAYLFLYYFGEISNKIFG
jgi:hypothetical protein